MTSELSTDPVDPFLFFLLEIEELMLMLRDVYREGWEQRQVKS